MRARLPHRYAVQRDYHSFGFTVRPTVDFKRRHLSLLTFFFHRVSTLIPACNNPAAYMTPTGMVLSAPGFTQQMPMIDYGQGSYASHFATTNPSPFAQDVAASVAAGKKFREVTLPSALLAMLFVVSAQYQAATVPQIAAFPGYTHTVQAAHVPGTTAFQTHQGYAAVQPQTLTAATNPAYAQLTATIQAREGLGLANP